jgi:XisI protein
MDKLKKYQDLIVGYLEQYAAVPYANAPELEKVVIADRERNHFQLVSTGWVKGIFSFDVLMHFAIKNDKIWILQNWTEEELGDELMKGGVPSSDIVLGFVPEYGRALSGFAVK